MRFFFFFCSEATRDSSNFAEDGKTLRGGDVRGIHEIMFFGAGETLTLKHEALDRGLFAAGAVKAMKFALEQDVPGLWTMEDVMFGPSKA